MVFSLLYALTRLRLADEHLNKELEIACSTLESEWSELVELHIQSYNNSEQTQFSLKRQLG
jgi:hypothetical protein